MHPIIILQCLTLLTFANGMPVIAKRVFGDFMAWPCDGGIRFFDGQPLFGPSKTIRGLVLAIVITSAVLPIFRLFMYNWSVMRTTASVLDFVFNPFYCQ